MQAQLSAASRLREEVLKMPGVILIGEAGHPDKIIRLQSVPEYMNEFKVRPDKGNYIFINLDKGPHQEAWKRLNAEAGRTARRDMPVPSPVHVAPDSHKEWSIGPDEVPLVENGGVVPQSLNPTRAIETIEKTMDRKPDVTETPKQGIFKCKTCNLTWDSNRALSTHERFAHKK